MVHEPIKWAAVPSTRRLFLILISLVGFAGMAACGPSRPASVVVPPPGVDVPARVQVRVAGQITSVALDDYVLGAVLSEVTPLDETPAAVDRIYEVQAIIARTYVVSQIGRHRAEGFDVCDTTHCQIYDPARIRTSRFAAVARAAVTRTHGRVLAYGGHVAEALFHADCGGSTTGADAVWGGRALPYLRAIVDNLTPETHRKWEVNATNEQLRVALNADARTSVGKTLSAIEIVSVDDSGRAAGLGIRGERSYTVRGDVFRSVLNQTLGARGLQSTKFALTRSGSRYSFEGTGFGHGVGLCQRGAASRIRRGDSVEAVLRAYYPGTTLTR
jgi:stage II sporulation protein D